MIRKLCLATAFVSAFALSAAATEPVPAPVDGATPAASTAVAPIVKEDVVEIVKPAATIEAPATVVDSIVLTEAQGKNWIDKSVYSSDGKNLGEVVSFQRNADDMVIGLHADIGGFLGMGQTRVAVPASQFKLQGDRVVLGLTAAQAEDLPEVTI
jgi:hypothetical protein